MSKKPLTPSELTELIAGLNRLARNLWWTWNQESQEIFQELSPRGWQNLYHNAVAVLREVSDYELRVHLQDPDFAERVRRVLASFDAYLNEKNTWGKANAPDLLKNPVIYFTAEFGFHETLPIAAGGLGILAGDHAKSASDLGLGFVGISLFYREGYFQQSINQDNWQVDYYTQLQPKNLPIEPVVDKNGEPIVCSVQMGVSDVKFKAWRVNVGRCPAYLLDTNLPENEQHYRDLTLRVYGGDSTTRILQEILLGIGGVRLMRALGVEPSVYHMNEGHAAFLALELIREKLALGKSFADALNFAKKQCIFTTHTPVEAGHDRFTASLMDYAFKGYLSHLKMSLDEVMASGPGPRESERRARAVLHDGARTQGRPRRQRRQRTARPGQPSHVAMPLARRAGRQDPDRSHHERHSPARLDEGPPCAASGAAGSPTTGLRPLRDPPDRTPTSGTRTTAGRARSTTPPSGRRWAIRTSSPTRRSGRCATSCAASSSNSHAAVCCSRAAACRKATSSRSITC
jgi:hypothetical protein